MASPSWSESARTFSRDEHARSKFVGAERRHLSRATASSPSKGPRSCACCRCVPERMGATLARCSQVGFGNGSLSQAGRGMRSSLRRDCAAHRARRSDGDPAGAAGLPATARPDAGAGKHLAPLPGVAEMSMEKRASHCEIVVNSTRKAAQLQRQETYEGKELRTMDRKLIWLGICLVALAGSAAAQTTVTSSGTTATTGNVPYVSAATSTSTTVSPSPISVSGSNVGIGTTSPQAALRLNTLCARCPNRI